MVAIHTYTLNQKNHQPRAGISLRYGWFQILQNGLDVTLESSKGNAGCPNVFNSTFGTQISEILAAAEQ